MNLDLRCVLSDPTLDANQSRCQRQLAVSLRAIADRVGRSAPLNLCLVLDHSGSMGGSPMETVKVAAQKLVERLAPGDRLSVVAFDHRAKVLVPNQRVDQPIDIKARISRLQAEGGTAIDEGLNLGLEELAKGQEGAISQLFLLTDGENEHGNNDRCLELAQQAAQQNLTLNTLGFGDYWNQDVLEKLADAGGGPLVYVARPEDAVGRFEQLFKRAQSVGLTNAHVVLILPPNVRLAEMKPIAQVLPDVVELSIQTEAHPEGDRLVIRVGDLLQQTPRVILANLYLGRFGEGEHRVAQVQVRYDNPMTQQTGLLSEVVSVPVQAQAVYRPQPDPQVQQYILALAKYRQTQIAETKLQQGDKVGAVTMLQTAAQTALQLGDRGAATVLQQSATQLQEKGELSEGDRKMTRIVSKTVLQMPEE